MYNSEKFQVSTIKMTITLLKENRYFCLNISIRQNQVKILSSNDYQKNCAFVFLIF